MNASCALCARLTARGNCADMRLIINNKTLTPSQSDLVMALLREEATVGRLGEAYRAKSILAKLGEE